MTDWRKLLTDEHLWDYRCKAVPVPLVREIVEEVETLRQDLAAARAERDGTGLCPRPANNRPDDFTVKACVEAGECGCMDGNRYHHARTMTEQEVYSSWLREQDTMDAQRYRWLRDESVGHPFWKLFDKGMTGAEMDAAIDASMGDAP